MQSPLKLSMPKNDNYPIASIQLLPPELLAIIIKYVGIVNFDFFLYYLNLKQGSKSEKIIPHTGFFYNKGAYSFTASMLTQSNNSPTNDPINNPNIQYQEMLRQITNERTRIIIESYIPIEWSTIPHFDIKDAQVKSYGPKGSLCSKIYKDLWYDPRLILVLKQVCKSWCDAIQDDQRYMQRIFGFKLQDL